IGDSYVEGWYVSDDDTVARRLEAELHAPVANLGVAGYGTLQQQRVVCGDALERHPRVLVWCFFEGNDLYDDQRFEKYVCPTPGADAAAPGPGTAPPDPDSAAPRPTHGSPERSFVRAALRALRRLADPLVPNQAPLWGTLSVAGQAP